MNKRYYEHTLPIIRGSLSNTYLRHSLATILLKEKVVLPVITGILGHKDSESTKLYLRLDIESLKQCALDVPPVADGFYMQNGGHFYE